MTPSTAILLITSGTGVLFIAQGIRAAQRRKIAQGWSSVNGIVVRSDLVEHPDDEGATTYTPAVEYEFVVEGVTFTGNQIAFGYDSFTWSRDVAVKTLRAYPVGAHVTVYYNPFRPRDCAIEPKTSFYAMATVVAGVWTILAGIAISYYVHFLGKLF